MLWSALTLVTVFILQSVFIDTKGSLEIKEKNTGLCFVSVRIRKRKGDEREIPETAVKIL